MGLTFAFWPSEPNLSVPRAKEIVEAIWGGTAPSGLGEAPEAIQGMLGELSRSWPQIDEAEDPDEVPWSMAHTVSDHYIIVYTVLTHKTLLRAVNDLGRLAEKYGLVFFDPQLNVVYCPDGTTLDLQPEKQESLSLQEVTTKVRVQLLSSLGLSSDKPRDSD